MGLLICVTVGALVVGWVSGGSLDRLARVPLRGWPLACAAVGSIVLGAALSAVGGGIGTALAVAGAVTAAGCLVVLLARNRRVEGVPLLAAGLLLNALVIAANGAMPVSSYAALRAGISPTSAYDNGDALHEVADARTRLPALGDVVPVPLPVHPETVSAGDMLIVAGVGLLIVAGMHRREDVEESVS